VTEVAGVPDPAAALLEDDSYSEALENFSDEDGGGDGHVDHVPPNSELVVGEETADAGLIQTMVERVRVPAAPFSISSRC
jgi:hypothetical protein